MFFTNKKKTIGKPILITSETLHLVFTKTKKIDTTLAKY